MVLFSAQFGKPYLRTSMKNDRLSDLLVMSPKKKNLTKNIEFDILIDNFAKLGHEGSH